MHAFLSDFRFQKGGEKYYKFLFAFESYNNLSNNKIQIVRHMSKLQEKIDLYTESAEKLGITIEADLFKLVTKGLGPSIYKEDSELVSSSNEAELETVKKNFLIKKYKPHMNMGDFHSCFVKIS